MSDCEQIAQVTHDKRATVNDMLRGLMIKEWMSKSLVFLSESLIRLQKRAIGSKNLKKIVFLRTFLVNYFFLNQWFPQPLFFKDQCERIHQDGSHSNFWNQRHSPGKLSKTCKHFFLSSIDRFWWSNWSRQSFSKIGVMDLITIKIK